MEFGVTDELFVKPSKKETDDDITGRFDRAMIPGGSVRAMLLPASYGSLFKNICSIHASVCIRSDSGTRPSGSRAEGRGDRRVTECARRAARGLVALRVIVRKPYNLAVYLYGYSLPHDQTRCR